MANRGIIKNTMKNIPSKLKYKNHHKLLSRIINSVDPIGLMAGGAPEDEYCNEVSKILAVIQNVNDEKDITDKIYEVFLNSFGQEVAGGKKPYSKIAKKIIEFKLKGKLF